MNDDYSLHLHSTMYAVAAGWYIIKSDSVYIIITAFWLVHSDVRGPGQVFGGATCFVATALVVRLIAPAFGRMRASLLRTLCMTTALVAHAVRHLHRCSADHEMCDWTIPCLRQQRSATIVLSTVGDREIGSKLARQP